MAMQPLRLSSRLAALLALAPAFAVFGVVYIGANRLDDLGLAHQLADAAELGVHRLSSI